MPNLQVALVGDFCALEFVTTNPIPRLQVRKQYLSEIFRQQNFLDEGKLQILIHKCLTVKCENHVNKSGCSVHIYYMCVGWKNRSFENVFSSCQWKKNHLLNIKVEHSFNCRSSLKRKVVKNVKVNCWIIYNIPK